MFVEATFDSDISKSNVSSVADMRKMFAGAILDCDLSNWDVSDDTETSSMFLRTQTISNIPAWFFKESHIKLTIA